MDMQHNQKDEEHKNLEFYETKLEMEIDGITRVGSLFIKYVVV